MESSPSPKYQRIEKLALLAILAAMLVIDFFVETKFAFLNFYFLPIMVAGYYLGKRRAVLLAFFTVLLVWGFNIAKGEILKSGALGDLDLTVWGAFLILAGWLGSLSEKLRIELHHSDTLRQELAEERNTLRDSIEKLNQYTHQLEKRVDERTHQLEQANKNLEWSVMTDFLTQLLNRRGMEKRLQQEKARFDRTGESLSVIIGDIDHFKRINDVHGHDAGDFVLRNLAEILQSLPRRQDSLARWGGEEFLLLLPETALEGAWVLAEKLRRAVESAQPQYGGQRIPITMSFGVATLKKEQSLTELLKEADQHLYAAKSAGRNQTQPAIKPSLQSPAS